MECGEQAHHRCAGVVASKSVDASVCLFGHVGVARIGRRWLDGVVVRVEHHRRKLRTQRCGQSIDIVVDSGRDVSVVGEPLPDDSGSGALVAARGWSGDKFLEQGYGLFVGSAHRVIMVPDGFSRSDACFMVTVRTPASTAAMEPSILGIIPLLTTPSARSRA